MEFMGNYKKDGAAHGDVPERKALVVDERPGWLGYYAALLEAYGYEVRRCGGYCEAIHCMDSENFDFVIVNQGGPKFEGSCVLKRAVEVDRHLPVVVVARCLDTKTYLEAMQLGATDYLVEPVAAWEVGRLLPPQPHLSAAA
jgi:DNA-binding NtrC family response regulator